MPVEALFSKCLILFLGCSFLFKNETPVQITAPHPIHLSVTEINHNSTDRTLEISCKLFTDDFEKILAQNYSTKVDFTQFKDTAALEKLVNDYIQKRVYIKVDGKPVAYHLLGFEKDQDVVYSYFQAEQVDMVRKIDLTNTLMYDLFNDQISLMHITVGGKRKSGKLDYPAKEMTFAY